MTTSIKANLSASDGKSNIKKCRASTLLIFENLNKPQSYLNGHTFPLKNNYRDVSPMTLFLFALRIKYENFAKIE